MAGLTGNAAFDGHFFRLPFFGKVVSGGMTLKAFREDGTATATKRKAPEARVRAVFESERISLMEISSATT